MGRLLEATPAHLQRRPCTRPRGSVPPFPERQGRRHDHRPSGHIRNRHRACPGLSRPVPAGPPPPQMHWKGGASRASSLCPATVPLTPSASPNGICNRQLPPTTALETASNRLPNRCWAASEGPSFLMPPPPLCRGPGSGRSGPRAQSSGLRALPCHGGGHCRGSLPPTLRRAPRRTAGAKG